MLPVRGGFVLIVALALYATTPSAGERGGGRPQGKPERVDAHGDPLPPGVLARAGSARFRHGGHITVVRYTADGKTLVTVGQDGAVRVWEPATGKEIRTLPTGVHPGVLRLIDGPPLSTGGVVISGDGKILALDSEGGGIDLQDVTTGKLLRRLTQEQLRGDADIFFVDSCALSHDGKTLATWGTLSTGKGVARVWDTASGKLLRQVTGKTGGPILGAALPPDGKTLVTLEVNTQDGTTSAVLWDMATGKDLRTLTDVKDGSMRALQFTPDGRILAAVDDSAQQIRLWDAATGKEVRTFNQPQVNGDQAFTFSPDSKVLAVVAPDRVLLWEVATGNQVREIVLPRKGVEAPAALAISPDGKTLAVAVQNTVQFWDVPTGKEVRPPSGHRGEVIAVAISSDRKLLATAGDDHTVRLWDPATGKPLRRFDIPFSNDDPFPDLLQAAVVIAPDGKTLAASMGSKVHLWDTATGKEVRRFGSARGESGVVFAPDGKTLATVGHDGLVRIWKADTGAELRRLSLFPPLPGVGEEEFAFDLPAVLAFSPDGKTLAAAGVDYRPQNVPGPVRADVTPPLQVRLWEVSTGKERRNLLIPIGLMTLVPSPKIPIDLGGPEGVLSLAFTPDSRALVVGVNNSVCLHDLAGGKEIRRFGGPSVLAASVVLSPDDKLLAAGTVDGTVRLWDTATGTVRGEIGGHRGPVNALTFARDGKVLVSAGADSTALVWDVPRLLDMAAAAKKPATARTLQELWDDLASADAAKAFQAIETLAEMPHEAVPFLKPRLRPVTPADAGRIKQLLADLGSKQFAVRQKATVELERLADLAAPALRKLAAASETPLETQERVRGLLKKLDGPVTSPELLRTLRAIEVLERVGTAEARQVLQMLAAGAPAHRVTEEAQAALQRLAK